jgi:hypothetical protein
MTKRRNAHGVRCSMSKKMKSKPDKPIEHGACTARKPIGHQGLTMRNHRGECQEREQNAATPVLLTTLNACGRYT